MSRLSRWFDRVSGKERKLQAKKIEFLHGQVEMHQKYHNESREELVNVRKEHAEEISTADNAKAYYTIKLYLLERFNIDGQGRRGIESMLNYIEHKIDPRSLKTINQKLENEKTSRS